MEKLMELKVMTWNMNYWQRDDTQRLGAWKFLEEKNMDIAILQETKPYFNCLENYNIYSQIFPVRDGWGSAIVTKKYNSYKHSFVSSYEGSYGLMCYDFEIEKDKKVTIINLYGKIDSNGNSTTTMHHILSDIIPIVWGRPKNLIIMAGDLNTSTQWDEKYNNKDPSHKLVFDRINDMGFINCTMEQFGEHRQTFVRENTFPYQDDYIFIKGNDHEWKVKIHNDQNVLNYSDHYPVELTIEI
jgi:endonuclease/exonuclease/phosphatase family metal-dependent hydrolase